MTTKHNTDEQRPTPLRWLLGLAGVLMVPLALIWWPGCREYPAVTTKESLTLVKLVYTACNTKDTVRLAQAEQELGKLDREGKMSVREKESFTRIITLAKKGDWSTAEKAALKFAQDQVGQGHPAKTDAHH